MLDLQKAGEQIALLRKNKGLTQESLAELLDISPQAVSKWENGHTMPEVSLLYTLSHVLDCSIDHILKPSFLHNCKFNYEFTILSRAEINKYTGSEWPRSIAYGSLFTTLKLFMGLETRRDYKNRQINDDDEYIMQSAISNVCFGYSWKPKEIVQDCFSIYGLDYKIYHKADYTDDAYITLIRSQIEKGLPAIIIPKEYEDILFAVGFSDNGKVLKGLGFLDGDDQKNTKINFHKLNSYKGWYSMDSDFLCVIPVKERMPLEQACLSALKKGIVLLENTRQINENKMRGYGMIMYQNWCDLLREENKKSADKIHCIFPHAFIHYENKLRTKQFFESCITIIPRIDDALISLAITLYDELLVLAKQITSIAHEYESLKKEELREKRNQIINMLCRSSEQESLALSYIKKAVKGL